MNGTSRAFAFVLVAGALALVGCGKKDDAGTTGAAPSASAPTPVATATASAADTAASATATPPPPPPVVHTNESLDGCCSAIQGLEKTAKGAQLAGLQRGMGVCPGLAKLVRDGKSSRAAALATLKASLSGAPSIPACN